MQAKDIIHLHQDMCDQHADVANHNVILSVDGVNETRSTSRSLEVVSLKFQGCQQVYPCLISRPEPHRKKAMKHWVDAYMSLFVLELVDLGQPVEHMVMDAPERANVRKQKAHGGYYSCDLCMANPTSIRVGNGNASKYTHYNASNISKLMQ